MRKSIINSLRIIVTVSGIAAAMIMNGAGIESVHPTTASDYARTSKLEMINAPDHLPMIIIASSK